VAGGLAGLGVRPGDRIAFLSRSRPELAISEVAALHVGAVGVALHVASPATTIEHTLADSDPSVLVVEGALAPRLTNLTLTVPCVVGLDRPLEAAPALGDLHPPSGFDFEARWRAVQPDDLIGIVYTSGTTGAPKGAEYTHRAVLLANHRHDLLHPEPDGICDVAYGAFAHQSERGRAHWRSLMRGFTRTFCADPSELYAVLPDARPTYLSGPPSLWMGLKASIEASADDGERAVLGYAVEHVRLRRSLGLPHEVELAHEPVLHTLRVRAGLDRMNRGLVAAAPCPVAVHEFFAALRVPLFEVWGMTEIWVATMTRPGRDDIGTCGVPVPGYAIRIADDGEVLVRTESRARGYRNRPEETAATFGTDGWVRTGDVGQLDAEGRVHITGRKKDLIVPLSGHNIAPERLESALLCASPLIAHACVVGEGRAYLVALIVPSPAAIGIGAERLDAKVAEAVEAVNKDLDPRERIVRHAVVREDWPPGGEELTETGKLRRSIIERRYAAVIGQLFADSSAG
jgi:long-subunit acyl-CoA synthetase (AMP-forming)